MKLRRVAAVARKEVLHIVRDARSLGMGIAIPLMLLILFGYALTLDVDEVPLAVWDQDRSAASRELISRFQGSRYFSLRSYASGYADIEKGIDRGEVLMGIVIPPQFGRRTGRGAPIRVQAIVDGSDANTAALATGYAEGIVGAASRGVLAARAARRGERVAGIPVDLRARVWFNADMESRNYIIPGLIAVIMMIIAALLTSLTVAREWETGTMEQLISTPLRGAELIAGKLLPYFAIGLLDVVLAVSMGRFVFGVPLRGAPLLVFSLGALFLVGALSLGVLISIVTRGQLLASQLAMVLTFLPAFLLSGFMYDIANMPRALQVITHLIPARYFVAILKGVFLKGAGLAVLGPDVALLGVFAAVMLFLANRAFRKKLA
jgi:ABC-2 type transport system permease protein